jgi:hypothetical protein
MNAPFVRCGKTDVLATATLVATNVNEAMVEQERGDSPFQFRLCVDLNRYGPPYWSTLTQCVTIQAALAL